MMRTDAKTGESAGMTVTGVTFRRAAEKALPHLGMSAPLVTDAEIAELRAAIAARGKIRTHSSNCWLWDNHRDCAILRLLGEIERLRSELNAVDDAISDHGVPEVNCTLPLPERVSNIISQLKEWRHDAATEAMENERLRAELRKETP